VAGKAVFEPDEATQERLLCEGKRRHVYGTLPATQNRAQCNHQQFMKVVQGGISGRRVGDKLIQHGLRRLRHPGLESVAPNRASTTPKVSGFPSAIHLCYRVI